MPNEGRDQNKGDGNEREKNRDRERNRAQGRDAGGDQDTGMASVTQEWGSITSPLDILQIAQTIFQTSQDIALRSTEEMSGHCDTLVRCRTRLDELEIDMGSREAEVVRDTPIEGRTNAETREAMFREVLEQDEKYAAWEQEKGELGTQYAEARYGLELATAQLSIAKRQLDFATNLMRFGAAATENNAAVSLPFDVQSGASI